MSVLIDTSVLIGWENDRFDKDKLPASVSVSVITVTELRLGVLMAASLDARARRLATLRLAEIGGADPGLREELREMLTETTDDIDVA